MKEYYFDLKTTRQGPFSVQAENSTEAVLKVKRTYGVDLDKVFSRPEPGRIVIHYKYQPPSDK